MPWLNMSMKPDLMPVLKGTKRCPAALRIFIVQEHHTSHPRYDLCLESEGVLISWAVRDPGETRARPIAVETDDHMLEFADLAGNIP